MLKGIRQSRALRAFSKPPSGQMRGCREHERMMEGEPSRGKKWSPEDTGKLPLRVGMSKSGRVKQAFGDGSHSDSGNTGEKPYVGGECGQGFSQWHISDTRGHTQGRRPIFAESMSESLAFNHMSIYTGQM